MQIIDELRGQIKNPFEIQKNAEDELNLDASTESDSKDEEGKQVIEEELIEAGKVGWKDYKELFSYAFGGMWGVLLIIVTHFAINLSSLAVSLFLAFDLTKKFTTDESLSESEESRREITYNVILISIISFSLISSFVGKFFSNKIFMGIIRKVHDDITQRVLTAKISFFEENT